MKEENLTQNEVVVTGALGIKKRKDAITSSYTVVKSEEIAQSANPNVVQSLAGKVSGLQINTTNNGVNPTTRIVLRGNRSISGNNQALIVVDNVIVDASVLQSMPPEWIESTNVIKGAQGAALYGSQGANGAIIVITKSSLAKEEKELLDDKLSKAIASAHVYVEPEQEDYELFVENQFTSPKSEPLSTFSIDVDNASYTNVRRFINQGQKVQIGRAHV